VDIYNEIEGKFKALRHEFKVTLNVEIKIYNTVKVTSNYFS